MTREKAVEVLETTRLMYEMSLDDSDCDEDSAEAREDNEETVEAINEAIKALKRQPCEDAISRLEAVKIVNNPLNIKLDLMLLRLPSVNPIPPKMVGETCEDAVSREAVIHEAICWRDSGEYHFSEPLKYLKKRIDNLPTVTPERPKGEWVYVHEGVSTYKVVCSKCGYVSYLSEGGFASMDDFKSCLNHLKKNQKFDSFCPNCGADMRGGKE